MNATRRKADPVSVPLRTITNAASAGAYRPTWRPMRPGADAHERYPSRIGDVLVYRDGRKEAA